MELSKELIEQHKLSEEQVKGITAFATDHIAAQKKAWDSKANENAENILSGAIQYAQEKTGFKLERSQGEKAGDYLKRFSDGYLSNQKKELDVLKADYETKLKEFKGGDALKSELDAAKSKLDDALKKYADYEDLKGKAEKADEYSKQLFGLKQEVAFNNIKPSFPDTINPYEAAAKWGDFKKTVLEKYTLEIVDGEPVAIDKENVHRQLKLKDLLLKDQPVQDLLKGRSQQGTGAHAATSRTIEGVPFPVPDNADAAERSKLIREYLEKQGMSITHSEYAKKFSELNIKIVEAKKTAV